MRELRLNSGIGGVESNGGGVDGGATLGGVIFLLGLDADLVGGGVLGGDRFSDIELLIRIYDAFFRLAEGMSGVVRVGGGVRGNGGFGMSSYTELEGKALIVKLL